MLRVEFSLENNYFVNVVPKIRRPVFLYGFLCYSGCKHPPCREEMSMYDEAEKLLLYKANVSEQEETK